MKPVDLPRGHLSPKQFDKVMAQFDSTQPTPPHPTGSAVSMGATTAEGTQRGRVGKVTAQHVGGKEVNVQWRRGDVTVEPVSGIRQRHDWTGQRG